MLEPSDISTAHVRERHSRATIFAGGLSALALMTVLSAYIGAIASFIPRIYTHWIGTMLFLIFGLRLLRVSSWPCLTLLLILQFAGS